MMAQIGLHLDPHPHEPSVLELHRLDPVRPVRREPTILLEKGSQAGEDCCYDFKQLFVAVLEALADKSWDFFRVWQESCMQELFKIQCGQHSRKARHGLKL